MSNETPVSASEFTTVGEILARVLDKIAFQISLQEEELEFDPVD